MRVLGYGAAALLLLGGTSCGGASSATGPSAQSLVGAWEFTRGAGPSGCLQSELTYYARITSSYQLDDGGVNVVTDWDVRSPAQFQWSLTGNINVKTRQVVLNFWLRTLVTGEEFDGVLGDDGTITGTLVDPKPGFGAHYTAYGSCTVTMRGRRVGA